MGDRRERELLLEAPATICTCDLSLQRPAAAAAVYLHMTRRQHGPGVWLKRDRGRRPSGSRARAGRTHGATALRQRIAPSSLELEVEPLASSSTCIASARQIEQAGTFAQFGTGGPRIASGIVPDGVASVTLRFSSNQGRSRLQHGADCRLQPIKQDPRQRVARVLRAFHWRSLEGSDRPSAAARPRRKRQRVGREARFSS
jgi:hypothetical protein